MEALQQQDSDPASASNRLHGSPLQSASKRLNLLESERWALKHLPNGFLPSQVGNACAYVNTRVSACVCVRGHTCGIHNSLPYCCETIFFSKLQIKEEAEKKKTVGISKMRKPPLKPMLPRTENFLFFFFKIYLSFIWILAKFVSIFLCFVLKWNWSDTDCISSRLYRVRAFCVGKSIVVNS